LEDAAILANNKRNVCAWYICGIALECMLKYAICRHHGEQYLTDIDNIYVTTRGHDLEFLFKEAYLWESLIRDKELHETYNKSFSQWSIAIRYRTEQRTSGFLDAAREIRNWIEGEVA